MFNYFSWLQKDVPIGTPGIFPELKENYETSVPGIYCIGDLTGIPLIKLAADSGAQVINNIKTDSSFQVGKSEYDLIICGAGPAGVAAAIEAIKLNWKVLILEAATPFNTLKNFPAHKPIYVTPEDTTFMSELAFNDGDKESLLEEYEEILTKYDLPIKQGVKVDTITQTANGFGVVAGKEKYTAQRVLVAIGSSGNARRLGVKGEDLPKVLNQLIDPKSNSDQDILVVGGGDSALEAATALAENGNRVALSYRKSTFARPKEHNLRAFNAQVAAGTITPYFSSEVLHVDETTVTLATKEGNVEIPNDQVYTMIGTEIPITFFNRSKIKMEGEKNATWWIQLITMLLFFSMLYFGKAGKAYDIISTEVSLFDNILAFTKGPFGVSIPWKLAKYDWFSSLSFILAWGSAVLFIPFGITTLCIFLKRLSQHMSSTWGKIKYTYMIAVVLLFFYVYVHDMLGQNAGWVKGPTYWYSLLYCTTMLLFGIRRMIVTPTKYVRMQTSVLIFIQLTFLFALPFYLHDMLIVPNFAAEGYLRSQVFPHGGWSSFGLILFWPLNMGNFGTSTFWTWFPFVQTFVLLPAMIYWWGKGVYCGWICSCGGMAETLGDEYRSKAPHGATAKKWENIGQFILLFAFITSAAQFTQDGAWVDTIRGSYKFIIDTIFAGVLGLGVYFFLSGRFWCRYFCPLAALMHIYNKFSRFRIFADKKRCISCNLCTKNCHMGIDVMNFANKGKPMNDVECVACSTCITVCPMDVLEFGQTKSNKSEEKR